MSVKEEKPVLTKSEATVAAEAALAAHEQNRPGAYESPYGQEIASLRQEIAERRPYLYDMASDPLYRQLSGQYTHLGRQAMKDTMGQAAANTGGVAGSYAVSAAQQAYNEYLRGMADEALSLEENAYSRYRDEGDALRDRLDDLMGQDKEAYSRYRDDVEEYYDMLRYLYEKSGDAGDADLAAYKLLLSQYDAERENAQKNTASTSGSGKVNAAEAEKTAEKIPVKAGKIKR